MRVSKVVTEQTGTSVVPSPTGDEPDLLERRDAREEDVLQSCKLEVGFTEVNRWRGETGETLPRE